MYSRNFLLICLCDRSLSQTSLCGVAPVLSNVLILMYSSILSSLEPPSASQQDYFILARLQRDRSGVFCDEYVTNVSLFYHVGATAGILRRERLPAIEG